jgi:hypothetical protein
VYKCHRLTMLSNKFWQCFAKPPFDNGDVAGYWGDLSGEAALREPSAPRLGKSLEGVKAEHRRLTEFGNFGNRLPCGNPEFKKQALAIGQAYRMCQQVGRRTESRCGGHVMAPKVSTLLGSLEKCDIEDVETVAEGPPNQREGATTPVYQVSSDPVR